MSSDAPGVTLGMEQSGRHATVCSVFSHCTAACLGCLAQRFLGLLGFRVRSWHRRRGVFEERSAVASLG